MEHSHNWHVVIEGERQLVDALALLLRTEETRLVSGNENVLTSSSFADLPDSLAVLNRAEKLLHTATALVNTFANTRGLARVRAVLCTRPDGSTHGSHYLLDISITTIDNENAQLIAEAKTHLLSVVGQSLLSTGMRHPRAKEALSFVEDGNPSWGNLYSALEAVKRQLEESGIAGKDWSAFEQKGWLPGKTIRTLKRVANRHRHAKRSEAQVDEMNLVDAQLLVKQILRKWLEELSLQ